jgi:hypothetical protein
VTCGEHDAPFGVPPVHSRSVGELGSTYDPVAERSMVPRLDDDAVSPPKLVEPAEGMCPGSAMTGEHGHALLPREGFTTIVRRPPVK